MPVAMPMMPVAMPMMPVAMPMMPVAVLVATTSATTGEEGCQRQAQ